MKVGRQMPRRLYKYRKFSNLVLDMLINDVVYFSDPTSFNDPLDTNPTLKTDVGADALIEILGKLYKKRIHSKMSDAAKTIRRRGPKTHDHIEKLSRKDTDEFLARVRYNATNPDIEAPDPEAFLFGQYVQDELLRRYSKGVFSLAERCDCPLMWSHYGDQHNGICVGYSVPPAAADHTHKVKYGGSREVEASLVERMLNGQIEATRQVDEAVLLRKAMPWKYEKEWRLLGQRGVQDSPLELEEVVFGLRCDASVKHAVVQALENRRRPVKFYEIREEAGRFRLLRRALNYDELAELPRRAEKPDELKDQFPDIEDE
jgi:hypothetical protein